MFPRTLLGGRGEKEGVTSILSPLFFSRGKEGRKERGEEEKKVEFSDRGKEKNNEKRKKQNLSIGSGRKA